MENKDREAALIGLGLGFGLLHIACDVAILCRPGAFWLHVAALMISVGGLGLHRIHRP